MESEFDNIKEVEYYDYSRNFYPSDENTTSNSHAVDSKQMRWTPNDNDNLNNIISDEVNQTTTTTTTTSASTNNGQFDDNLLNSSDKIDLKQKLSPLVGSGDDNSLHHASTLENNGEEFLATGGYDNKNGELLTPTTTTELDDNDDDDRQHEKILEKNLQPHHQQLVDADGDYGPETCVDVTDDVVMMTENSADTNNLSEQSTLSHSKDTLPSSDNCNPFDNKNALDMEETNEFQLGHAVVDVDAHIQSDDANKATPLLSPEVEDLPLSSDGQMHFTNEGYQQSPLDDEIPVGIGCSQNEFEDEFMQSNGHLSPIEAKDNEVENKEKAYEEEAKEEIVALAKLESFGDLDLNEVQDMSNQKPELVENFFGSPIESELVAQEKEILFNNIENDENDFRLKDEEEILEKHVLQSEEFPVKESEALDLSQKEQLQQSLHNLEVDILEEKPILTGNYFEEEINFDESPMPLVADDEEKQSEFSDEKQDKEEFSEKEDKVEEKLSFVEQKSTPSEEIELEEDNCIHLEEDVRPSDYLAMLERQKEEQQYQHLGQLDEGFEKEVQFEEDDALIKSENEKEHENSMFEEDNKDSDEMMEKEMAQPEEHHLITENQLVQNELTKEHYEAEELEKIAELQKQLQQPEETPMIDEILENNKLESEVVSLIQEQNSLIEDSIVQPEKQCFEEPEKIQEKQENVDLENNEKEQSFKETEKQMADINNLVDLEISQAQCLDKPVFEEVDKQPEENIKKQLQDSNSLSDQEEELENRHLQGMHEQVFEEMKKQLEENTEKQLEDLNSSPDLKQEPENRDVVAIDQQLNDSAEYEDNLENKHLIEQPFEGVEKQLEENTEKQTQDVNRNIDFKVEDSTHVEIMEEESNNSCSEDIDKQVQDLAEFVEDLENKHSEELKLEETIKLFGECTEEQLQKLEQQVLDADSVRLDRPKKVVQLFAEPDIDPENMVEVEEPIIIKEQVPIKPNVVPVSAQEPSAVQPTHESCDESEDDEWKYTKEGQGEKQLGLQGDTVVEEELPQEVEDAGVTFSIERKASGNILQQQISINTSNLIETINDTFEGLTQNITELADQAAAAVTETKEEQIEQGVKNLNLSQSSTREELNNIEDEEDLSASEMNSRLNPEAKEFVPTFSPPSATTENGFDRQTPTAIPAHFKDELISQSPRKGRESNMEDINIPAENEFEEEIAHKPHGLPGDEAITEPTENGGVDLFQKMNWKEAMHGSEKEEGPLGDSPVTEESLEVVENILHHPGQTNICELSAPVDLDNAGMKESIYIENNTLNDDLNALQILPVDEIEIGHESAENLNKEANDVTSSDEVQEILALASDEKVETKIEDEIEQKMEQLLLSHDKEFTKDVKIETEDVPINGVEMAPVPSVQMEQIVTVSESVPEQPQEPSAPAAELAPSPVPVAEEAHEGLVLGAAVTVVAATAAATATAVATTSDVKKVEDEKNQKNLKKTSSATKSKVPDTKKPPAKTSAVSSVAAAKRTLADKPKSAASASSLATKKTVSSTAAAAPRPRAVPAAAGAKTPIEKKTTTSTTSTVKSRIDAKPPTTLATRKPLTSSATKTTASKPGDETKSSSSTVKSSTIGKSSLGSKPLIGSTRTSATNSITKPRPATASSTATTNGTATKAAAATKPTTLAPKSAAKSSTTSPRGTLTSTLRKTEAVKSPTKTTSSTITSRVSTNGVTKSNTTTRTTTTKTTTSSVPATTRTTTSRLSVTGTTTGSTTPTTKTNNLLPRKSTPLKKTITNSSTTPIARKSIGSKLNSPATKPTKDTSTPRPVTIPAQHQNQNSIIAEESKKAATALLLASAEGPKLNGNASPDDVLLPSTEAATVAAHPLIEMETV